MDFDTFTIKCFIALAETRNSKIAAAQLSISVSAVNQKISKLESSLGKILFMRHRNFLLTNEGECFLAYAKKILALSLNAWESLNKDSSSTKQIKFGVPEDFATAFLPDLLSEVCKKYPTTFFSIECDLSINLWFRFQKKEFDFVLVKMAKPEIFPESLELKSETLEWVGSDSFLSAEYKHPIPLILSPQPCIYRSWAVNSLNKAKIKWRFIFSSPSYAGKIAAVKAGIGITVLPKNMVPEDVSIIPQGGKLPQLPKTKVSLLMHNKENQIVTEICDFISLRMN